MDERYAVRTDHTAAQDIDGEAVVLNFDTYHYYGLNKTATAVWTLLSAGGRTTSELTGLVADAFGAPAEAVTADVRMLVDTMLAEGLIAVTTTAAASVPALGRNGAYVAPHLERHGKLDQLMLSGE